MTKEKALGKFSKDGVIVPEVDDSWKESDLASLWFVKVLEKAGYGAKGVGTFRTERRTNNKKGLARQDFTLSVNDIPLIHVELKRPSVKLDRESLDFEHFQQAHRYAVSHYVRRSDQYVTPLGVLTNGKTAYLFDGSIEKAEKSLQLSLILDLTKASERERFYKLISVAEIVRNGGFIKNEIITTSVVKLNRTEVQGADVWLSKTLIAIFKDMRKCGLNERDAFTGTITYFLAAILRDCGYIPTEQLLAYEEKRDWFGLVKTLEFHLRSPLTALMLDKRLHEKAFHFYGRTQFLPVRLDVFPADGLGRAYEDLLHYVKGNDAKTSYYTPRELIEAILDQLNIKKDHRVLDPCTGSSGFLTSCVERVFKLGLDHDPKEIKAFIEKKLVGVDKDWFAVQISKAALTAIYARYLPDEAQFKAPASQVYETDFFDFRKFCKKNKIQMQFDRILGNPPWGDHQIWLDSKYHKQIKSFESYKHQTCVSIYVFEEAVSYLKPKGAIGMVLKHELLDGVRHENFRKYLTKLSGEIWDYGRRKLFTNNSQTIVVFGKNNLAGKVTVVAKDDSAVRDSFEYDGTPLNMFFNINKGFESAADDIYEHLAEVFPRDKNTKPLIAASELAPFTSNEAKSYYFLEQDDQLPKSVREYCDNTQFTRNLKKSKNRSISGEVTKSISWHLFSRAELIRKARKSHAWLWIYDGDNYFAATKKIFSPRFLREQERINAVGIYDTNVITKTDTCVLLPKNFEMRDSEFRYCLGFLNSKIGFQVAYSLCKQAGGKTVSAFPEYFGKLKVPAASEELKGQIASLVETFESGNLASIEVLDKVFSELVMRGSVTPSSRTALADAVELDRDAPVRRHRGVLEKGKKYKPAAKKGKSAVKGIAAS